MALEFSLDDDSDFEFGLFFEGIPERRARCLRCGWVVMPDELSEHRNYSCAVEFGELPDPGFPRLRSRRLDPVN